ncbi:MAG: serine/threonine protein kinase [Deltaproteobacteria bacterium]|nr:serine/threonine protein kinase [Deltaproteobacteria bacterium]
MPAPNPDRVIDGRYRLQEEIGAGGMGTVYRAVHDKLDREVAVKVLSSELGESKELRLRFEREARNLAAMSHPNIVTVTDYGHMDEAPYLVMELLEGEPLDQLIARDAPVPAPTVRIIFEQILRALAFTHSRGLAHRDLKPANVFLQRLADDPMHVKLLDFGLAKFVAGERKGRGPALTKSGTVIGTPAYMSPEQAAGQGAGERGDVYSAGILLFEMLAGTAPFQGDPPDLIRQHLISPVPSLGKACPGLRPTPEFDRFIAKATEKEARSRFGNAGEMLASLAALPRPMVRGMPTEGAANIPRPSLAPTALPVSARDTPGPGPGETPDGTAKATPSGPGASPHSALRSPRTGWAILAIAGAALLFLAPGAAVLTAILSGGDETDRPPAAATPAAAAAASANPSDQSPPSPTHEEAGDPDEPATGVRPTAPPTATATPDPDEQPGVDPWAAPVPDALVAARQEIAAGALSQGTEQNLENYIRRNRTDPRGFLLLGHGYLARGWRPDALDRYERAYDLDPSARADPEMRDNLIRLAGHGNVGRRARAMVMDIYGPEARPLVQALLDGPPLRHTERAGIERLRDELAQ